MISWVYQRDIEWWIGEFQKRTKMYIEARREAGRYHRKFKELQEKYYALLDRITPPLGAFEIYREPTYDVSFELHHFRLDGYTVAVPPGINTEDIYYALREKAALWIELEYKRLTDKDLPKEK